MANQRQSAANRSAGGIAGSAKRSLLASGIMVGIGIMGFLDESILHQLLQWHSFYWATDQHGRILSDGLFHVFSTIILLWGGFRLWQTPPAWLYGSQKSVAAAILIGMGAFNSYDGIVQHLILHVHLVNEHVCPNVNADNSITSCPADIPFEVAFTGMGLALLIVGIIWWRHRSATGSDANQER